MKPELGPRLFVLAAFALMLRAADGRAGAPAGRFVKSSGVVTDTKTGLIWQQPASAATYVLSAAYTHCTDQGTGWRLPTAKELLTLVDTTIPQSEHLVIDMAVFAASQVDKNWWSSSVVSTAGSRNWAVNFESGGVQGQDAATPLYVRCVK